MSATDAALRGFGHRPRRPAWLALAAAALVALGLVGAGAAVGRGLVESRRPDRTVSVRGLAEREVEADLGIWPIAFSVAANDLSGLDAAIRRNVAVVLTFLADSGIADADVTVGPPAVRDSQAELYAPAERRPFRYIAKLTVTVRSDDIGAILAAAARSLSLVGSGIAVSNDYGSGPQFVFNGLNSIKPAMIADATRSARLAAEQFAADSGSVVGKIKQASQGLFTIEDVDPGLPQRKLVRVVTTVDYFLTD